MTVAEALRDVERRLQPIAEDEARIEAEVLICHALDMDREHLFARLDEPLSGTQRERLDALLRRRLAHEPLAYITGHREFYGLDLVCTPDALIPRPETELLVELALKWVNGRGPGITVVDVGTGNGAIAVAVAANAPGARVVAVDPSRAALRLAARNAERHRVRDRVALVQGELLSPFRRAFDVILANLPYVPTNLYERAPPEIRREPEEALHAGRRGTALIEALLEQAPPLLAPGGLLVAEHAWNQGARVRAAARRAFPEASVRTERDLAGRQRALVVKNRRREA